MYNFVTLEAVLLNSLNDLRLDFRVVVVVVVAVVDTLITDP